MATHNITDGTGGMDASLRFADEQVRAEVCCHFSLRHILPKTIPYHTERGRRYSKHDWIALYRDWPLHIQYVQTPLTFKFRILSVLSG